MTGSTNVNSKNMVQKRLFSVSNTKPIRNSPRPLIDKGNFWSIFLFVQNHSEGTSDDRKTADTEGLFSDQFSLESFDKPE